MVTLDKEKKLKRKRKEELNPEQDYLCFSRFDHVWTKGANPVFAKEKSTR
jgi:hypothetical protein